MSRLRSMLLAFSLAWGLSLGPAQAELVGYWPFEEGVNEPGPITFDAAGSFHGNIGSAVTRAPGLIGQSALRFDNTNNSAVDLGSGGDDGFMFTSELSIEALIAPEWSGAEFDYDEIFRKEDGGNRILFSFQNDPNNGFAVPPVDAGPVLSFGLGVGGVYEELDMPLGVDLEALGGVAESGAVYLNDPGVALGPNDVVLQDGGFHQVAATYDDNTGEKSIYVNGVLRWSTLVNFAGLATGGDGAATIGNVTPTGGEPFTGVIDEFALYDHALTPDEVATHYDNVRNGVNYFGEQPPLPPDQAEPTPNLPDPGRLMGLPEGVVSYWDFDEAAGPSDDFTLNFAYDRQGDADGTFVGTAARTDGIIGLGAALFDNEDGSTVNVGSGGPDNAFSVTDGLAIEALIITDWSGAEFDYDEIFRKEDGGNRILFSFQNDPNGEFAVIPVEAGPVLSLGLNIGEGYGELDMPLGVDLSELEGGNENSGTIYLDDPGGELGPNDVVLKDGQPHHVLAQYDVESGDMAIFVDGVKRWSAAREPGSSLVSGGAAAGHIGSTNGGEVFTGTIDEVVFWSRALTETEIDGHIQRFLSGERYFELLALLAGDANGDGSVDLEDFTILKTNFGAASGASLADGDFNGDGAINLQDFTILKDNFGATANAVPEPSGLVSSAVALLALLGWGFRRKRTV